MSDDDDLDDVDDRDDDDDDLDEGDDRYEDKMEDRHLDGDHLGNPDPDCPDCVREAELNDAAADLDLGTGEPRRWYAPIDRRLRQERKLSLLSQLRDAAQPRLPRPPHLPR